MVATPKPMTAPIAPPVVVLALMVCRSRTRFRLRDLLILVDQPVDHLSAPYSDGTQVGHRRWDRVSVRWALSAALMWTMLVVVRQVSA
jgi:hypothetical protein